MRFDKLSRNGEAEAGAVAVARACLITTPEPIEDMWNIVRRNATARIRDSNRDDVATSTGGQIDASPGGV